jgi:hypothetical protein
MTDEEKVKSRYPHASAEKTTNPSGSSIWTVWNMTLQEQERLNKEYPRVSRTRALIGLGANREEAWSDAVRCIEKWEGKSLPV